MANIASAIKRGFLRSVVRQAKVAGVTLEEALAEFQDAQFEDIKSGRVVASTAHGQNSVSFSIPASISQLQPDEFFSLSEELCAAHDTAKAALITGGNATPNIDQIYAEMLEDDTLHGTTGYNVDLTCQSR